MNLKAYRKAVVAFIISVIGLAAFFVQFDPGFQAAAIAVTVAVFNVVAVFMTTNHTAQDLEKSVKALTASVFGLLAFFVTVDPDTAETVTAIAIALANVYGVYKATNRPSRT